MKKITKFLYPFMLIFPISVMWMQNSCTPEVSCENGDTIDGIIVKKYNLGVCYQYMQDTTYVINDIVSFQNLRSKMDSLFLSENTACDTAKLIAPDFEKYTLLACFAEGQGCDAGFHRTVLKDETQRKYTYTIEVEECGNCAYKIPSMNWVLVSKLPENYTVDFKVTHKTNTLESTKK